MKHYGWPINRIAIVSITACMAMTACVDQKHAVIAPQFTNQETPQAPNKGGTRRFSTIPTDSLWAIIAAMDSVALVGIKAPGSSGSIVRGVMTASSDHINAGSEAIRTAGGHVIRKNQKWPFYRVKIGDAQVLQRILQHPLVAYVEPATVAGYGMMHSDPGCAEPSYGGAQHLTAWDVTDLIPFQYMSMGIYDAWRIASGDEITVGLVDTGIYSSSEQMNTSMEAGYSAIRWHDYTHTVNYTTGMIGNSGCSHGHRMAAAIAAPRDGVGPIGVAWGANLVSVRHNDDIAVFDVEQAADAIDIAALYGRIIVIAWGSPDYWFNSIEDAIEFHHYTRDRLFVAAAGTYPGLNYLLRGNTIFPAEMDEVVAVTAASYPSGYLSSDGAHGPAVDIGAFVGQVTAGKESNLATISGSSNASAAAAGIAALIWSRYPQMSRDQVRDRLYYSTISNPYQTSPVKNGDLGYGIPNAFRAVGGMWHLSISGPSCVDGREGSMQLTAIVRGDGPFTYSWSNGETGSSIIVSKPPRGQSADYSVYVHDGLENKTSAAYLTVTALAVDDPRKTCE